MTTLMPSLRRTKTREMLKRWWGSSTTTCRSTPLVVSLLFDPLCVSVCVCVCVCVWVTTCHGCCGPLSLLCEPVAQLELYAQYSPSRIMELLQRSEHYDLEKAQALCVKHNMLREQIYLLGRTGNTEEGLTMIITKVKDDISRRHAKIRFLNNELPPDRRQAIPVDKDLEAAMAASMELPVRKYNFSLPERVRDAEGDAKVALIKEEIKKVERKIAQSVDQEIRWVCSRSRFFSLSFMWLISLSPQVFVLLFSRFLYFALHR